jgi:hypothetical protein
MGRPSSLHHTAATHVSEERTRRTCGRGSRRLRSPTVTRRRGRTDQSIAARIRCFASRLTDRCAQLGQTSVQFAYSHTQSGNDRRLTQRTASPLTDSKASISQHDNCPLLIIVPKSQAQSDGKTGDSADRARLSGRAQQSSINLLTCPNGGVHNLQAA